MEDQDLKEIKLLCDMLGDENRAKIMKELLRKFPDGLSVSQVTHFLQSSQPNTSKHLSLLSSAGLLESSKNGTLRIYCVPDGLEAKVNAVYEMLFELSLAVNGEIEI